MTTIKRTDQGEPSPALKPARKYPAKPLMSSHKANSSSQSSAPPRSSEALERQGIRLGFLIHDVSRMRRTAYDHLMKPLGVTRAQWWVLAHASRSDGMMQTQLADALDVGKASLGTVIERLETAGLIDRREDPVDKRAKRIYVTRAGRQLLEKMMKEENRLNELILGELSPDERETMIRQLTLLKHALSRRISQVSGDDSD